MSYCERKSEENGFAVSARFYSCESERSECDFVFVLRYDLRCASFDISSYGFCLKQLSADCAYVLLC